MVTNLIVYRFVTFVGFTGGFPSDQYRIRVLPYNMSSILLLHLDIRDYSLEDVMIQIFFFFMSCLTLTQTTIYLLEKDLLMYYK